MYDIVHVCVCVCVRVCVELLCLARVSFLYYYSVAYIIM